MDTAIDLVQAEAFIAALTGDPSTSVLFQLADDTEPGETRRDNLTRVLVGNVRQHANILGRLNAMGAAIWMQINTGRRGAANVIALRALFVDDDGTSEKAPEINLPPSIVVASSNGERNRHYYWRLRSEEAVERFTPAQKHLISALDTDKSISNLDRCMRLPGSHNMKRANRKAGPPEPVRLLFADRGRQYSIDEVLRAHPVPEATRAQIAQEKQPDLFTPEALAMARRIALWLADAGITFTQQSPVSFRLKHCVFNPQHIEKMAIKIQGRGGVWSTCFHDSCGGIINNRWAQVKDRVGGWAIEGGFSRGDDVEIAGRLLRDLGADSEEPLVFEEGQLWRYETPTGLWRHVDESGVERHITTYAGQSVGKRTLTISGGTLKGVLACLRALAGHRGFFDSAPPGIAFANGFLGITPAGAAFMPHSPDHRQRVGLPFPYEQTLAPRWLRYLHECFVDDPDAAAKIALLQEFVGACLVGCATKLQKALLLVGDGANGKSVFTSTICALFPSDTRACVKPQDWGKEYYRAALAGKRVNIVAEIPDHDILSGDAFKEIVAGDETDGRQPAGRVFRWTPIAGHIFSANRLPGTGDQSHGFWRRQIVIMFNRIFKPEEQDPQLASYLAANEMPGIAAWAAMGAERILAQNAYTLPPSDAEARAQWRQEADPVAAFLADCTEPAVRESDWTPAGALYATFQGWLKDNGHRIMSSTAFGRRLRGARVQKDTRREGNYYGVRLTIPLPVSFFLQ